MAAIMDSSERSHGCICKSSCSTKRKGNSNRGCPCKGQNLLCGDNCNCGTREKPCKNRESQEGAINIQRNVRPRRNLGFRLSSDANPQTERLSEDAQRVKENNDVKEFIATLDQDMIKKLAIRSLRRGVGSMDYIHSLLIMEDDLDETNEPQTEDSSQMGQLCTTNSANCSLSQVEETEASADAADPSGSQPAVALPWCVCRQCRPMPQEIENKCCKLTTCITSTARFAKLCLDVDVLEMCVRNAGEIRNDREDTSTRSFRKAAYRQFILARHGHLGKGNRRVCPSCVVLKIRQRYPSVTGVYMGYREH